MITENSTLWEYLSPSQRELANVGLFLLEDSSRHVGTTLTDYSYLVFPFAKLYEGFLKQLFLDLRLINDREYRSDHYRVGKTLSPHLVGRLRARSAYGQIESKFDSTLALELWQTWKNGRNLVFHYFPHNIRALTLDQAKQIIFRICDTMEMAVAKTNPHAFDRTI